MDLTDIFWPCDALLWTYEYSYKKSSKMVDMIQIQLKHVLINYGRTKTFDTTEKPTYRLPELSRSKVNIID